MPKDTTGRIRHAEELARLDRLAHMLDARFKLFGFRFGYDSLLGLIPGVGDTISLAPSAWLVWRAHQLGVPRRKIGRMAVNTGVDYVVGSIPVIGTIFDVGYKSNRKNAGFTDEEREGMTRLLEAGFVDTFRHLHPDLASAYSWWSYRAGARQRNVGWRIDYFVVSDDLASSLRDAFILPEILGSDHCPVGIRLARA